MPLRITLISFQDFESLTPKQIRSLKNAENQKRYRERIKSDHEKYQLYRLKENERVKAATHRRMEKIRANPKLHEARKEYCRQKTAYYRAKQKARNRGVVLPDLRAFRRHDKSLQLPQWKDGENNTDGNVAGRDKDRFADAQNEQSSS